MTSTTTDISNSSYTYVVLRRGKRPTETTGVIDGHENKTFGYNRLINNPRKKKGHVLMRACSSDGEIDEFIVSKSQGSEVYSDARKSHWGDLWPYEKVVKGRVDEHTYSDQ